MIVPSREVLLISAADKKEVFMFDPKTACVLQTYSSESELAATAAYFELGQEFLIPHLNNTYINVWDTDAQQPRKFSVGDGQRITALLAMPGNILLVGSSHGVLYMFELPSGILIRKVQLHSQSNQIRTIIFLWQLGYIVTGTRKELKLWPLRDIITPNQKPISEATIHSVIEIIGVQLVRNILCVVTDRSVQFYHSSTFSLFALGQDQPVVQNVTCCCASNWSLFLGDALGKIQEIIIDAHEKELAFQQRKGKVSLQTKKAFSIQGKDSITTMAFVEALQFLVVGNSKGEIKIWHGRNLKNSVQLSKSSIGLIKPIARPNKEKKIPQSHKIKSLHKQEQSKVDQPIVYESGDLPEFQYNAEMEPSAQVYLDRMLAYLNDPAEQLEAKIQEVERENRQLTEANMHYFSMLGQPEAQVSQRKSYQ